MTKTSLPETVINGVMIFFALIYIIFILILLPMWYKTIEYSFGEKEIISRSGLFSRTERIMKLSSIQQAEHISFPLSKHTGFNFIALNALGGRILLMFLSDDDCSELMDFFYSCIYKDRKPSSDIQEEYTQISFSEYDDNGNFIGNAGISPKDKKC